MGLVSKTFMPVVLLLGVIVMSADCSLRRRYIKSYTLGQNYSTLSGENMFYFYNADVHTFFSGLHHSNRVYDYDRVVYNGLSDGQLKFSYYRELKDGEVLDFKRQLSLKDPGKRPLNIFLGGFYIRVEQASDEAITFRVVRELDRLEDGSDLRRLYRRSAVYLLGDDNKAAPQGKGDRKTLPAEPAEPDDERRGRLKY